MAISVLFRREARKGFMSSGPMWGNHKLCCSSEGAENNSPVIYRTRAEKSQKVLLLLLLRMGKRRTWCWSAEHCWDLLLVWAKGIGGGGTVVERSPDNQEVMGLTHAGCFFLLFLLTDPSYVTDIQWKILSYEALKISLFGIKSQLYLSLLHS